MPRQFESVCEAIIGDDRDRVAVWLDKDPALVTQMTAGRDRFESRIVHHIYEGDTLLHVAAAAHCVEIARRLLAAGARVDAASNRRRSQPLHYAADGFPERPDRDAARQVEMIRLLLAAGAEIHARDKNGATPLHRAVRTRCAEAVKTLLAAGADATLRNEPGSTPFHLAVQNAGRGGSGSAAAKVAQRSIIHAFLDHGIKPDLRDGGGRTVLERATSSWIRELLAGGMNKIRGMLWLVPILIIQ